MCWVNLKTITHIVEWKRPEMGLTNGKDVWMAKFIFLAFGALLLVAVVFTVFQYFIIHFLRKREEDGEEWFLEKTVKDNNEYS